MENVAKALIISGAILISILGVAIGAKVAKVDKPEIYAKAASEAMWGNVDVTFGEEEKDTIEFTQLYCEEGAPFDIDIVKANLKITLADGTEINSDDIEIITDTETLLTLPDDVAADTKNLKIRYNATTVYTIKDAIIVVDFAKIAELIMNVRIPTEKEFNLINLSTNGPTEYDPSAENLINTSDLIEVRNKTVMRVPQE